MTSLSYPMEYWEEKIERSRAVKYQLFQGRKKAPCMWCYTMLEFDAATIEHVVPNSHGGPLTVANCAVACQTCNQKRGTKSVEEFKASEWLQQKRQQIQAQRKNRRIPRYPDGVPMDDDEVRLNAQKYLESVDKAGLLAIIMGMAKQGHLDTWASQFVDLES